MPITLHPVAASIQSGKKLRIRAMVSGNTDPALVLRFSAPRGTPLPQEKAIAYGTTTFDVTFRASELTTIDILCEAVDGSVRAGVGTVTIVPAEVRSARLRERVALYARRRGAPAAIALPAATVPPPADDDVADADVADPYDAFDRDDAYLPG